ncbi:plexin-B1-like [Mytilus edulis]|uniref:plexin-B1-like n=1 Tax=Mytilus edulis TaxID=6550 RepID=UPI0039F02832
MGGTFVTIMGQNLGTHGYNISVYLNGVRCNNVTVVQPFNSLTCVTGKSNTTTVTGMFILVNESQFNDSSNKTNYMYKIPSIDTFSPEKGILAGNTTITIKGSNICFKGKHRYTISLCDSTKSCIPCSVPSEFECRNASIRVRTLPALCPRNMTTLKFGIDDFTAELYTQRFEYLPDPTFIFSNHTPKSLQSGGATFTVNGEGFNHVGEITVERVKNPCDVKLDIEAVCQTPEKKQNESDVQSVRVYFDGLTVTVDIEYVDDPQFDNFQSILEYNKESPIKITGTNILHGAIYDDYSIHVGLDGKCIIKDINMTYIICLPPTFTPRTNETDEHTVFVVVEVGRIKAYIGKLRYKVDIDILAIIVGLLAAAFVIAVVVGVFTVFIMKKKKRKVIKEFKLELLTREEMIRKASREEFADAQMTMREIKSDLVTSRVPFRDYQTYVLYQLFPNQDIETNPLLHDSKLTDNQEPKMKNALEKFDQLLSNKVFLKTLVQTLDRKNMLTMQEKAHFSSVLSIALLGNMRLLFDLVNCLLADMIHSSTKKQHKVLFRRFDSITLRLMANWLQIGLYGQLTAYSGMHLFMLYKAVQTIIEMSPIDALTGNAKNTIAEEKLLKMRIEHQPLTLQIDLNGNSDDHYPVRVLDCDTISQVKQKSCAQIYKNKPASERPRIDELTLEWQEGSAGKLILDDIDNISETGNGLVRLNTLKHYMVKDNCKVALMYNHHDDQEVYVNSATFRTESMASEDITLLMPDRNEQENVEIQKWHLVCTKLYYFLI